MRKKLLIFATLLSIAIPGQRGARGADGDTLVNHTWSDPPLHSAQHNLSIAVRPSDGRLCAGWYDSAHYGAAKSYNSFGYSDDGGLRWHDQGPLPPPASGENWGAPAVRVDGEGNFFYSVLLSDASGNFGVGVAKSTDGCNTFSSPVIVHGGTLDDKPLLTIDTNPSSPFFNTLYVTWIDFASSGHPFLSRSADHGATWSSPVNLCPSCPSDGQQGPFPFVAPNGDVFVVWLRFEWSGDYMPSLDIVRSTDGGVSFGSPVEVVEFLASNDPSASAHCSALALNGDIRYLDLPSMTIGPDGTIHIVFSADPDGLGSGDAADIFYTFSTDSGATWSAPLRLNDDATQRDQFFPTIVSNPNGILTVYWYDRRNDPDNLNFEIYRTSSYDGGITWTPNIRVSGTVSPLPPLNPHFDSDVPKCYMGEYQLADADSGKVYLVWSDSRRWRDGHRDPDGWFKSEPLPDGSGAPCLLPTFSPDVDSCPSSTETISLTLINNTGFSDTFLLSALTSGPVEVLSIPSSVDVGFGEYATIDVGVKILPGTLPGTAFSLSVTATAQSNPTFADTAFVDGLTSGAWQRRTDMATGVADPAVVEYDGLLYVVGGHGSAGSVQIYDPQTDTWSYGATEPTPAIEYPSDGCLGLDENGDPVIVLFPDGTGSVSGTIHRYHILGDSWDTLPAPPELPSEGIWGHDIAVDRENNICYISGGATLPGGGNLKSLYAYYPDSNTAAYLGEFDHIPSGFSHHASWYVPWLGTDGSVCVGGGVDVMGTAYGDTQCYDLATGTFHLPNSDLGLLPVPLWGMADAERAQGRDHELWIAGGAEADFATLHPASYFFSERDWTWYEGPLLQKRVFRFEADGKENGLYALGGSEGSLVADTALTSSEPYNQRYAGCPATYAIVASAGEHGALSPSGLVGVNEGESVTFTMLPEDHYHVADVLVDGFSVGPAAYYTFSGVTANHTIHADFAVDTYVIAAWAASNGSISPSGAVEVNYGGEVQFFITPDENHHVADVLVDGVSVGPVSSYVFSNVDADHTIFAAFGLNTYTITASAGLNGSIAPSGAVAVPHGQNQIFAITPDDGYHVADVQVDGSSVGAVTSYSFTNVTEAHTISASFAINTYTINAVSDGNGTISPSGMVNVTHGSHQAFTITPNAGYSIADVLVDGTSVGPVSTYTFFDVTASHSIRATFVVSRYAITTSTGPNGSISPSGTIFVKHGDTQVFLILPNPNYRVADVVVDGVSVGAVSSYTFSNVTAPHTIYAAFALKTYTIGATAGSNGSVTPSGVVTVTHGENPTFAIVPNPNYHVADVIVDGSSVGPVTTYTFSNVQSSHTIHALFEINRYAITASAGANGTISPSGTVWVDHGGGQTFAIIPNANYRVSNVVVDGFSVGAVTSYQFENVTASHTIQASFVLNSYSITANAGPNGSISPSGTVTVDHGTSAVFTFTPGANYHVADVIVDGVSQGPSGSYVFSNVTAPHSIYVTFALDTYVLSASAGSNGSISPSGLVTVNHGASQIFAITPNVNYHIADVEVDGVSVGPVSSYTFTNVTSDHTIYATFALDTYTIWASAGANGTISPSGIVTLQRGSNQTFTFTPAQDYSVENVWVDGVSVGALSMYTFNNVTRDHTIHVSFKLNTYTITATAGGNGFIFPSGSVSVEHGGTKTFSVTPSPNYHIADVRVDGASVGAVSSYSFVNVTTDHTIHATFAIDTFTITATAGPNGTISPSGSLTVNYGDTETYTITPSYGYRVLDVVVDGVSVGPVNYYSFTSVAANHTIYATFALRTYTITATADPEGGIFPSGAITVNHGTSYTFTAVPDAGYHIGRIMVDGISAGEGPSYTFTNITANHTIHATFVINTYTITAAAGPHGTISPSGSISVDHGGQRTFLITPDTGYRIADVQVDGRSVGAVPSYTFENVSTNHTISVFFTIQTFTITATAGDHGDIFPSGSVTANYGSSWTFSFSPDPGYAVLDIWVDGLSLGAGASYTFNDVRDSHWIHVVFGAPEITVFPTSIDFGNLPAGSGAEGWITILNNGLTPLVLGDLTDPLPPFSRRGGSCGSGTVLLPGESCSVLVGFSPSLPGPFSSTLTVASNDLDEPTVSVALMGSSGPDLVGRWTIPVSQVCASTCKITGTLTVQNVGTAPTTVASYVRFYLSDDGETYSEGSYLKQMSTGKLVIGKSKALKFSYTFKAGINATGKYLIAVLDSYNSVAEGDETNNKVVSGPIGSTPPLSRRLIFEEEEI